MSPIYPYIVRIYIPIYICMYIYIYICPPITPLKVPYSLGPWTLRGFEGCARCFLNLASAQKLAGAARPRDS